MRFTRQNIPDTFPNVPGCSDRCPHGSISLVSKLFAEYFMACGTVILTMPHAPAPISEDLHASLLSCVKDISHRVSGTLTGCSNVLFLDPERSQPQDLLVIGHIQTSYNRFASYDAESIISGQKSTHNGRGDHAQFRRSACTTRAVCMLNRARRIQ